MKIDSFERDENNAVWVVCGNDKVQLSAEYIEKYKPQIGDELVEETPEVSPEEPK